MAIRFAWLAVAVSAVIGPVVTVLPEMATDGSTDPTFGCYSVLLVLFWIWNVAWQFVVIMSVVDATVARSVGSRCSSSPNVEPLLGSFRGVMHSSLG